MRNYETCGKTPAFCDNMFLASEKMIIVTRPLCGTAVVTYYLSVDGFGEDSWKKGQEYCI
jgi:hypothetical protein